MKKIKITITGALGRMGKILIKRISKNKNLKLFSLTDLKSGKNVNGINVIKETTSKLIITIYFLSKRLINIGVKRKPK